MFLSDYYMIKDTDEELDEETHRMHVLEVLMSMEHC